ncbi:hypothetical protein [Paenibacillus sp. Z6-24]
MSVAQLAEQNGGNWAAVIRLCKSAGFKGYQELMLKVAGDLRDESPIGGYQEIHPADSIQHIIEQVSSFAGLPGAKPPRDPAHERVTFNQNGRRTKQILPSKPERSTPIFEMDHPITAAEPVRNAVPAH